MLVPGHPLWNIQSSESSVNKKLPKIFNLKFSMTRKMSFPDPLHLTIQSPGCSVKEKIPKNVAWPKKVGAQTPSLKNSESRVLCN